MEKNPVNEQPSTGTLDILVAEDDPTTRRLASKWLKESGYQVRQATDGQEALALIEQKCPAILVTDWQMPRMTGLELCRAVRQVELPHYLYILFLTAKANPESVQEALAAGADDFLAKPTDQNELLSRVRQIEWSLERRQRQVELAETDPLTGVLNHRTFDQHCLRESSRAARYGTPLSCVFLDLDLFKTINDTHGHPVGDAALKAVADVLSRLSRNHDLICRSGGDEFCVLLPETNEHGAARWAERVRLAVAQIGVPAGDREAHVSVTIGVAQWRADLESPQALVDLADQALRTAKRTGRDRVQRFSTLGNCDLMDVASDSANGTRLTEVQAGEIMTTPVLCLCEDEPLRRAADFFLRLRVNSAPIVDQHNKLVGIVSEQDLLGVAISHKVWDTPVREVMKTNVVCYEEDTPALKIWEFLRRVSFRRVVIVKDHVPTGVISRGGLLRWLGNWGMVCLQQGIEPRDDNHLTSLEMFRKTTASIRQDFEQFDEEVQTQADDVVPCVVNGVTRMQERLQDLLALSQVCHEFRPDDALHG
jgi:diguanylate cyclase (GGDEF)-like protein